MARRQRFSSNTVRTVGALLPSDVLAKAMAGDGLEGLDEESYGLDPDVRVRDAVNDAWNEARSLWWRFLSELRDLPESDVTATTLTRERWLIPLLELLGFDDIEVLAGSISIGEADYPISHLWNAAPIHLMGSRVELDSRVSGIPGAARLSPHSLTQQFLNRSDDHLWGIVSNGYRLRILRDSVSLTRQAFVEFDLEAMFNGEVFVDFALLYRVAHATRFDGERPEECLLERWIAAAREEGIRALEQLREGVESALTTLGTGLLRHPDNTDLRASVDSGDLDARNLYRHLLRLVYRLLFLFVAEDRDLLLLPDADPAVRDRYDRYYSTGRLRELASLPTGAGHADLWAGLASLMRVLGRDEGEPGLGLPGLGSFLWAQDSIGSLIDSRLDNEVLMAALQGLAYVDEGGALRRIDFAGMGAEELGSVYESLLELHPAINAQDRTFELGAGAGSERKTTGSYYTPTELVFELLDSALDPVLDEAAAKDDPEKAILDLKIVDPAAGSGHFLVAAAHRVAKRLAAVRTGEPEPAEAEYRSAVRDVVSRCLFAVDVNDLAVELCKVSLWLEAIEPGKPLSFLDHHILVGNSLFGATPAAIAGGIPDEAFEVLTGDDKKTVSELKKRNRTERSGQDGLPFDAGDGLTSLGSEMVTLEDFDDDDLETVRAKERMLADWNTSPAYRQARLVADTWCAAFAMEKTPTSPPLTDSVFRRVRDEGRISEELHQQVARLAQRLTFFHWHLAFPQVFLPGDPGKPPGWKGGFDVVLGNPPWERVKLQEKEFFALLAPDVAAAPNKAARQRLIHGLERSNPSLVGQFRSAVRDAEGVSHFLRRSGVFPLCGRGDVNTYAVFAELMRMAIGPRGSVGVIVPTGIVSDDSTKQFFSDLMETGGLASLYGFYDRKKIFRSVDVHWFGLLTLVGPSRPTWTPEFVFLARSIAEMRDPRRRFHLTASDIELLNPNTRTCPIFRSKRDADITKAIYRRWPVLVDERRSDRGPWGVHISSMYHMSSDSSLFQTKSVLEGLGWNLRGNVFEKGAERYLPLYEAKMIHQFNHRWATYEAGAFRNATDAELMDPSFTVLPRYWVSEADVMDRSEAVAGSDWFGFRDISKSTNSRTIIACEFPWSAVSGKILLVSPSKGHVRDLSALASTFVFDYVARQKISGSDLKIFRLKQLPVPPPSVFSTGCAWDESNSLTEWLGPRVAELASTSNDLGSAEVPVFSWATLRRDMMRGEIDAAFFHLYRIDRDDVEYILGTFPVVKRRDVAQHGSYRTKELILDVYDHMAEAIESGEPYQTILDPPPADPGLRVDVEPAS